VRVQQTILQQLNRPPQRLCLVVHSDFWQGQQHNPAVSCTNTFAKVRLIREAGLMKILDRYVDERTADLLIVLGAVLVTVAGTLSYLY
jgi:hypothetical protein